MTFPNFIPVPTRITSGPLNYCIYCNATGVTLTDEHIIPKGLRGRYELLKACCVPCQKIVHVFETDLMKHAFHPVKRALGLRGSKTKTGAPIQIKLNNSSQRITSTCKSIPRLPAVANFPVWPTRLSFK